MIFERRGGGAQSRPVKVFLNFSLARLTFLQIVIGTADRFFDINTSVTAKHKTDIAEINYSNLSIFCGECFICGE